MAARFLLHHAPKTRSAGSLWLLEEAGADYELEWHDMEAATHKAADYLRINPAGKLPALVDRGPSGDWHGVVVTEAAAIAAYVADTLPGTGLAPLVDTPARAAYATWMATASGVLEPAIADLAFPRAQAAPARALGWPPLPEVAARIEAGLETGPWLLGEHFTAADILIGGLLAWITQWGMFRPGPGITRYLTAIEARPARQAAIRKGAAKP